MKIKSKGILINFKQLKVQMERHLKKLSYSLRYLLDFNQHVSPKEKCILGLFAKTLDARDSAMCFQHLGNLDALVAPVLAWASLSLLRV